MDLLFLLLLEKTVVHPTMEPAEQRRNEFSNHIVQSTPPIWTVLLTFLHGNGIDMKNIQSNSSEISLSWPFWFATLFQFR